MSALLEFEPRLRDVFAQVQLAVNAEKLASARLRSRRRETDLAREAPAAALHFFSQTPKRLEPLRDPTPSPWALEVEDLVGAIEDDYVTDDAGAFPGWDRSEYSRGGWWEFHQEGRRLLVKNINVSPQEAATGADLVYVRRSPDAFVLVQYKMLEVLADGRVVFRPDGRLGDQVKRMLAPEASPRGTVDPDDVDEYRLGDGFSFVKFVSGSAPTRSVPGEITPGFYLPSEFARRVLAAPGRGPHGGVVHFIQDHRHFTSGTFAKLVRDRWVGSTGDVSTLLRGIFRLPESAARLTIAVDEPIEHADALVVPRPADEHLAQAKPD
jgi:hypothetical protein